jgi:hypothetical protein
MVLPYAATFTDPRSAMCCRPHFSKGVEAPFVHAPANAHEPKGLALHSPGATTLPRPPHPIPTFVTMANAPLRDGMAGDKPMIWVRKKRKYF